MSNVLESRMYINIVIRTLLILFLSLIVLLPLKAEEKNYDMLPTNMYMFDMIDSGKVETLIAGEDMEYIITIIYSNIGYFRCVHKVIDMQRIGCWELVGYQAFKNKN